MNIKKNSVLKWHAPHLAILEVNKETADGLGSGSLDGLLWDNSSS